MRRGDLQEFVGALEAPVERFAREAGLRLVLLINESGQVLAQRGFARALDVMGVAALGAGIHASSRALAELLGQPGFGHLHQGGAQAQVFIGPFRTPAENLIVIAVFVAPLFGQIAGWAAAITVLLVLVPICIRITASRRYQS